MTRAADPTSVLCKRYSMYEPGKRVARGWNARRRRRRTSGESRDTVQRRYKERRGGRVEGRWVEEGERKERREEKREEQRRRRNDVVRRLASKCVNAFTVPARSFVRHRAERSRAERFASSLAAGNAQTHASLPRDQTANTVGLPLRCDNSLIARKDTRRAQPTLSAAAPFSLSSHARRNREERPYLEERERDSVNRISAGKRKEGKGGGRIPPGERGGKKMNGYVHLAPRLGARYEITRRRTLRWPSKSHECHFVPGKTNASSIHASIYPIFLFFFFE